MWNPAVVLPVGAVFVAFFAVAVPAILLVTVWALVTAFRLLFPERPLPFRRPGPRRSPALRGQTAVRLRDIVERQAEQPAAPLERAGAAGPEQSPLFEDLWLRRN